MVLNWRKMVKSNWFYIMWRGVYPPFWHGDHYKIGAGVAETALVMFVMGHWYNHFLHYHIIFSRYEVVIRSALMVARSASLHFCSQLKSYQKLA